MNDKTNPTRRRFWPRFTLRVLLVFVTLVGIGLGYWTHRARQQRRIVERIQQGGGMVCYERDGPLAPEPRNFVVEWMASVLTRDYLERVVAVTVVRNEGVLHDLDKLRGLESLQINDDALTDEDLIGLANCRELRHFLIGEPWLLDDDGDSSLISDKSLVRIARLPNLESARVQGKGFTRLFTRLGIEALAESSTLRDLEIGLFDPSVNASDFEPMRRLGRIESLQAWGAKGSGWGGESIIKW
jgi:hypothetical protein